MVKVPQQYLQRVPGVLSLALCIAIGLAAHAQQAPDAAPDQSDSNKLLLQRVNELEVKIKQLQEKEASAIPAPEPAVEQPRVNSVNDRLKLNVFGDVGFETADLKPSANSFEIGSLDLFMTAHLSERVSALAEVLFVTAADNSITPDVERLLLQYRHNDHFTAGIGRYHTSIGYYNTAFHQGSWFQTTVDRPFNL